MANVSMPWGTENECVRRLPSGYTVFRESGVTQILINEGNYEVWHNNECVLPLADKEQAINRFNAIISPSPIQTQIADEAIPDITIDDSKTIICPACGEAFPEIRKTLLGVVVCAKCTPQKDKPLGVMNFDHKTAGVLMVIEDRAIFKILKKPINQQR